MENLKDGDTVYYKVNLREGILTEIVKKDYTHYLVYFGDNALVLCNFNRETIQRRVLHLLRNSKNKT